MVSESDVCIKNEKLLKKTSNQKKEGKAMIRGSRQIMFDWSKILWKPSFLAFALSILCLICYGAKEAVCQSDYPNKPITIYVGYAAGGQTDIAVRKLAPEVSKSLGQPVVVENKPGAGSIVAAGFISKQAPDGYRLAAIASSALIRAPHMQQVPYDPFKDITPLIQLIINVPGIFVKADSSLKSFVDFAKLAKMSSEPIKCAIAGTGSGNHLTLEALKKKYGFNLEVVPFQGDAPSNTAILGGHLPVGCGSTGGFGTLVKQGELRLLALFGDSRINFFPEVPTGKELGYDLALDAKMIIVGPPNLSPLVIQRLEDAFSGPIGSPGYQKMLKDMCVTNEPYRGSKALQKLLLDEDKLNKEIIRTSGLAKE